MLKRIESVKITQLKGFKNAATTPPKKTESVHSIPPYNKESH